MDEKNESTRKVIDYTLIADTDPKEFVQLVTDACKYNEWDMQGGVSTASLSNGVIVYSQALVKYE